MTTRPINELLQKVEKKEQQLIADNIIPEVVVCGAGAAGTELAFAYKARWSKLFGQEIKVTLLSNHDQILKGECNDIKTLVMKKLGDKNIEVFYDCDVRDITVDTIYLKDGRSFKSNAAVWATGATP